MPDLILRRTRETELEKARRLVREGEERLASQEAIVAEMRRDNQREASELGGRLLDIMRAAVEVAKRHLANIERRSMH
jgi:hypothetical protein